METRFWQKELECAPLDDLVARLDATLATTDTFVRAARSPLYRGRWQVAGVDPAAIRSYASLQAVPFTTPADLRVAQATHHPDEFVCSETRPRYWLSTSGSTGVPKWIPVGLKDLDLARQVGYRLAYFSDRPATLKDAVFGVSAPAPFVSDTALWAPLINELREDSVSDVIQMETIGFSFERAVEGVGMALKRRATVSIGFPSLLMRVAEGITESAPREAERALKQRFSLLNLLVYLVTRVHRVRPRDLIRVHSGIFSGEPLEPYRRALFETWGLENAYDLYGFTEYGIGSCECWAHDGLHVWIDVALPEIISQADLDREREEPGFVPPARPLWSARRGDEGELVLTYFGDCFPLVRWRTGDLIHVCGSDPCRCGRTHPRVWLLQRSDDLVNLGIIRFSTFALQAKLEAIARPAPVARWQLRIGRQGYKPLPTILVRPAAPVDEGEMIAAVESAAAEVEVFRMGWENGVVCRPVVKIVPDLGESLSTSGKFRPLVYENPTGKEVR